MASYSYLGPVGTFCNQALLQFTAGSETDTVPCISVRAAMDRVRDGECDYAVVPIENSVEGGVSATLDSLAYGKRLQIIGETTVPVAFTLAARPGTTLPNIRRVGTHSHAWAQCRNWMLDNLGDVSHVATASTADAARLLAAGHADDGAELGFEAVLASSAAVSEYGLTPLVSDVADNHGALTRFVLLSPPGQLPEPTGADKTTIQVRPVREMAGALHHLLQQFSSRGVNLSRIESRPDPANPGEYSFSIDLDGHILDRRVRGALHGLYRTAHDLRFLGSYPAADHHVPETDQTNSNEEYLRADTWIDSILHPKHD